MSTEIEAKLAVASHDVVRTRLLQHGAPCIARVIETNSIYDRFEPTGALRSTVGRLRKVGAALRVRSVETLEGERQPATMTFKGPVEASRFKKREELELPLNDAEGMRRLLTAIGFVEVLRFRKRRESWRLQSCRVELDELPRLGCFVEIEGPDEAAIQNAREALGLANAEPVKRSYVGLLADAFGDRGAGQMIDFDPD